MIISLHISRISLHWTNFRSPSRSSHWTSACDFPSVSCAPLPSMSASPAVTETRSVLLLLGHGNGLWTYRDDLARFVVSNVVGWAVWVNNNYWTHAGVVNSMQSRNRSCVRWDLAALLNEGRYMFIYSQKECRIRHFCTSSLGNTKQMCINPKLENDRTRRQLNGMKLNVGRSLMRKKIYSKTFCSVGFAVYWSRNNRSSCFFGLLYWICKYIYGLNTLAKNWYM